MCEKGAKFIVLTVVLAAEPSLVDVEPQSSAWWASMQRRRGLVVRASSLSGVVVVLTRS